MQRANDNTRVSSIESRIYIPQEAAKWKVLYQGSRLQQWQPFPLSCLQYRYRFPNKMGGKWVNKYFSLYTSWAGLSTCLVYAQTNTQHNTIQHALHSRVRGKGKKKMGPCGRVWQSWQSLAQIFLPPGFFAKIVWQSKFAHCILWPRRKPTEREREASCLYWIAR